VPTGPREKACAMEQTHAAVAAPAFTYDPQLSARSSAGGFFLDALRRRPGGRAVLSALTILLFVGGSGMFAYPFFTDLYTDQVLQGRLSDEFGGIDVAGYDDWEASLTSGDPLTRIAIPAIDVDTVVVAGTSPAALRAGAGHYPSTVLPGQDGNVGIAGHRTTYGRPFNQVDELVRGDEIWLQTPVGDFRYVVGDPPTDGPCEPYSERRPEERPDSAACITHPRDWSVVSETDEAMLTLTTCHPKGSAAERMIIRAALDERYPPGYYQSEYGDDAGDDAAEA
jgi:sortase A